MEGSGERKWDEGGEGGERSKSFRAVRVAVSALGRGCACEMRFVHPVGEADSCRRGSKKTRLRRCVQPIPPAILYPSYNASPLSSHTTSFVPPRTASFAPDTSMHWRPFSPRRRRLVGSRSISSIPRPSSSAQTWSPLILLDSLGDGKGNAGTESTPIEERAKGREGVGGGVGSGRWGGGEGGGLGLEMEEGSLGGELGKDWEERGREERRGPGMKGGSMLGGGRTE